MYTTSKGLQHHYHSVFTGNIKDSKPIATQNLMDLIEQIQMPSRRDRSIIREIRACDDDAKKAYLKTQLRAYTPCVLVGEYRRLSEVIEFTGLMSIDFDKIPDIEQAKELRYWLYNEIPSVYASWMSASGKGVRAIVHCERMQGISQKKEFWALFSGFYDKYIKDMNVAKYFDFAPKNVTLPLFQSYDPDLLYREDAECHTYKRRTKQPVIRSVPPIEQPDDDDAKHCMNIIAKKINHITDNGHPQLRAAAFTLGGYVGAGYIQEFDALAFIYNLIERNNYLSKKGDVYKQTAKTMVKQGSAKPLYLKK